MAQEIPLKNALDLISTFAFQKGKMVLHVKTGSKYYISGACYIENDVVPAYIYTSLRGSVTFVRPQAEMEDGRFVITTR